MVLLVSLQLHCIHHHHHLWHVSAMYDNGPC